MALAQSLALQSHGPVEAASVIGECAMRGTAACLRPAGLERMGAPATRIATAPSYIAMKLTSELSTVRAARALLCLRLQLVAGVKPTHWF